MTRARPMARLLAACLVFLLPACNLRPLYGPAGTAPVVAELAAIEVRIERGRVQQLVRNQLLDQLNPDGRQVPVAYELILQVEQYEDGLAIQLDATATRYDTVLLASYALRRAGEATPIYTASSRRTAGFDSTRAPYALVAAREDSVRRAAIEVAQDIRTRLATFLREAPA